jgi:hypothetical protein
MRISRSELIIMILVTISLFVVLANYAPGGPLGTDVVGYVNHGINGVEDTKTINRYFHTFLQGIFARTAPTPLIGVQYYWAFLIALSSLLVYVNARLLTKHSNMAHGLLAVLVFWSIGILAETAGSTQVDIPAMFITSLIVCTYLASARRGHSSKWLIGLLGLLYYFGFRTKEVVMCTFLLVIGLGFAEDDKFEFKLLLKRLGYLAAGAAAGIAVFLVLNSIFLHDPLFGFRWSDYQAFLADYGGVEPGTDLHNWFTAPLTGTSLALLIFLLYLISGIKAAADPEARFELRLLWLIPISMVAFLALTIGNQYGMPFRYLLPALAIMCSLGVQLLNFEWPSTLRGRAILLGVFGGGMLLFLAVRLLIKHSLPASGWDEGVYLEAVFFPLVFSLILVVFLLLKRPSNMASAGLSVMIVAILTSHLTSNFRSMFIARPNQKQIELIFYPLSAFASDIEVTPGMQIYIASDTWTSVDQWWTAKNHEEMAYLFNVYFDAGLSRDQVTSPDNGDIGSDILQTRYSYVLMRTYEWARIEQDASILTRVQQDYDMFTEPKDLLVLLRARNP